MRIFHARQGVDPGEFLAAKSRKAVGATDIALNDTHHLFQHIVADKVAVGVIDTLEIVQVDDRHAENRMSAIGTSLLAGKKFHQVTPVVTAR